MGSDLLTDPTPVPAGSWVTIGFYQNLLGAANFLTSWSELASQWIAYLPSTWPLQKLVINDSFTEKNAVVQVQVPSDTTIGAIATLANSVSLDVGITRVTVNGVAPASDPTLAGQAAANTTPGAKCLSHPIDCLLETLQGPLIIAGVLLGLWLLYETGALAAIKRKVAS